jgi:hypothetical protein
MMPLIGRIVSLGLLTAAVVALGCSPPASKAQFNNRMAEANKDLAKAASDFRAALLPARGQNDFDPATVKAGELQGALDKITNLIKKLQATYADVDLPRGSSAAEALKSAYLTYLGEVLKIRDKAAEIVALANGSLGNAEKTAKIAVLINDIRQMDDAAIRDLQQAQNKYCEAHNYKLVDKFD